jgi:ABC-type multidrug transport system fused ATPase/permease subunit
VAEAKRLPRLRRTAAIWRRLLPYLRPHRGALGGAAAMTLVAVAAELVRPWPVQVVVDHVLGGRPTTVFADVDGATLTWIAIAATLLLALLGGAAAYCRDLWLAKAGQRAISTLRGDALHRVLAQSLTFHEEHRSGDLLVRLCSDAPTLRTLLVDGLFALGRESLLVFGTLAVMAWLDWRLALAAVAVLPLIGLLSALASVRLRRAAHNQRKKEGALATSAHTTLGAVPVIQAYGLEAVANAAFGQQNRRSARAGLAATRIEATLALSTDLAMAVGTGFVLWLGIGRVQAAALSTGELLVVLAYVRSFYRPIKKGLSRSAAIVKAAAAGERVLELLDADASLPTPHEAVVPPPARGAITCRGVSFQHGDGRAVLRGLDLVLAPGEHVALLGGNGAGKTTLASLLPRLRDVTGGAVLLDDVDVRHYPLATLRSRIAVVLQESVLFPGTLRENVWLGRPTAPVDDVDAACALAGVTTFAHRWPDGLDTEVGERGAELSGGERQRVAIARALLRDAAVYVFDEPSAGLDADATTLFVERILPQLRQRTVLLITHDTRLLGAVDRVVTLTEGRLDAGRGGLAKVVAS